MLYICCFKLKTTTMEKFDLFKELSTILQPIRYTDKVCLKCGARIPEYLERFELCSECQLRHELKTK